MKRFPYIVPKPVTFVGALVDNVLNFLLIADISTIAYQIPRFVVISGKNHYTNRGIIENESFSVNILSEDLVIKADYCGLKSGKKVDKSKIF